MNKQGEDGRAVANFVLDECETRGRTISNLSLQKIVFFCHAWCLATLDRPLVRHNFEAWQHGPVLPFLYREFNEFGESPISSRATRINSHSGQIEVVEYAFDDETTTLLRRVVDIYSRMSAGALVSLSHAENGPWHRAWKHEGVVNPGMVIDHESIRDYYKGRFNARQSGEVSYVSSESSFPATSVALP